MNITILKKKIYDNKEHFQDIFVEVVGDILTIVLGIPLFWILKNFII